MEKWTSFPIIRVWLLGPLEVARRLPDGSWQTVDRKEWRKSRAARSVLKMLCVTPGRRLSRWRLQEEVWPESTLDLADNYLYLAISVIHAIVGKDLVTTWEAAYELAGQEVIWTDLDACERLLKGVEDLGHLSPEAFPLLEEALSYLERGELLEGETGSWCHGFRQKSEELLRQCRLWLAENYEAQGKLFQAGLQYRALTQTLPPDEDALRCWMEMLTRQGQRSEAWQCYQEARAFFAEQEDPLSPAFETFARKIQKQSMPEPRLSPLVAESKETMFALSIVKETEAVPDVEQGEEAVPEVEVIPEQAVSSWQPDPHSPETALRSLAWIPLLQDEQEKRATHLDMLYDTLETEILVMALRWQRSSPLAMLQQLTYESIRRCDAMHNDSSTHDTKLTRRHALQAIALFPIQMYSLTLFASERRTPPPEEMLSLCAAGLSACLELRQYEPEGMLAMQRILAVYLPNLERLAHQSSPSQQKAAYLAAQGYLLVNILASHHGRLDQMEAAARMARSYAQLASDPNLEISALLRLATTYDLENRDEKALDTYQEVLSLPAFSSVAQVLQWRTYAGLAATSAYCQQTSQALSFLSQAKEYYAANLNDAPSESFNIHESALVLWEGLTLEHTGHYSEAVEVFQQRGKLSPVPGLRESGRAEYLNYVASAAVKQRELETASCYLDAAEEVAWNVAHEQRYAEVRETLRGMKLLWPDEPKVKALQEKMFARQ